MAERTNIPGSAACGEWETLLADALDGLLGPEAAAKFEAHKAVCPACAALYEESRKGREWLEFLSPEPEAPAGLLDKILSKTGPGHPPSESWTGPAMPVAARAGVVPAFVPPVWQKPGFFARMRYAMQPRLLMTAAMAFFSIALTLNITGFRLASVHVTPLRLSDLRPRALRAYMERQLTMASVPIVRYYDHLRFVYEVESRVRALRGQAEGEGNQRKEEQSKPGETKQNPGGKDGGFRTDPQEEPGNPAMEPAVEPASDVLESALENENGPTASNNAARHPCERSTVWIASTIAV
jgi:hypothetical protein